jgi:dTDP-4-dehydrorhamnose reductase
MIKLSSREIKSITTKYYLIPALRSANLRLDTTEVRITLSLRMPKWQDEVEKVLKELIKVEKSCLTRKSARACYLLEVLV